MILGLQTNLDGQLRVWVRDPIRKKTRLIVQPVEHHGSERCLQLIDRLLRSARMSFDRIQGIIVVRGPGRFTAVRTGLVVANTIAVMKKIPVHGAISDEPLDPAAFDRRGWPDTVRPIRPVYGREPNITISKKI